MARGAGRPRSLHVWFVYASLAFLLIWLARRGLLAWPEIHSVPALIASLPLLLLGFLAGAGAWRRMLSLSEAPVTTAEAVASMGLSIFGKYVPGKVWTLLGRAAYVADRRGYRLATLSALSVNDQVLGWWVGLGLGGVGLAWVEQLQPWAWTALAAWLALSGVLFTPWLHRLAEAAVRRLLRSETVLPAIGARTVGAVLPWACAVWIAWSAGFYLLVVALNPGPTDPASGLAFALGATLGAMTLLAPGGLGVREGVVAAFLLGSGVDAEPAVSIAAASRLWFLVGETLFFGAGLIAAGSVRGGYSWRRTTPR